ncbi:MAG: glycosyltransferase family 39 protein [Oscillochloridaceae bacterium umkhey_bin13]
MLFLGALGLRIYRLDAQSLWLDEGSSWALSQAPWSVLLLDLLRPSAAYPLYHVLLKAWMGLFGASEAMLRLPSALAGAFAVPVIYLTAIELQRLRSLPSSFIHHPSKSAQPPALSPQPSVLRRRSALSPQSSEGAQPSALSPQPSALKKPSSFILHPSSFSWPGLAAALLVAVSPYAIWYSQEAKVYSLLLLSSALLVWAVARVARTLAWRDWLLLAALALLSLFIHRLSALLLVGAAFLLTARLIMAHPRRPWWAMAVPSLLALGLVAAMVNGLGGEQAAGRAAAGAAIPAGPGLALGLTFVRFSLDRWPGDLPIWWLLPWLGLTAWGLLALLRDLRQPVTRLAAALLLTMLMVPLLLFLAQLHFTQLYEARYLTVIFPLWALWLTYPLARWQGGEWGIAGDPSAPLPPGPHPPRGGRGEQRQQAHAAAVRLPSPPEGEQRQQAHAAAMRLPSPPEGEGLGEGGTGSPTQDAIPQGGQGQLSAIGYRLSAISYGSLFVLALTTSLLALWQPVFGLFSGDPVKEQYREMVAELAARVHPDDAIVIHPAYLQPLYAYYMARFSTDPAPEPLLFTDFWQGETSYGQREWDIERRARLAGFTRSFLLIAPDHARTVDRPLPGDEYGLVGNFWRFSREQGTWPCGIWRANGAHLLCQQAPEAYTTGAIQTPATPLTVTFGPQIQLLGVTMKATTPAGPGLYRAGGNLPLSLFWDVLTPVANDYSLFLHLCQDCTMPPLASEDGPPLEGYLPTSSWLPGKPARDDRAIALPRDLPPGQYTLLLGLYDPNDPTPAGRLTITGGTTLGNDRLVLGTVEIIAP